MAGQHPFGQGRFAYDPRDPLRPFLALFSSLDNQHSPGAGVDFAASGPEGHAGFSGFGWGPEPGFGGGRARGPWGGPFGPRGGFGPWGRGGCHGRRCRRDRDEQPDAPEDRDAAMTSDNEQGEKEKQKDDSPDTLREDGPDGPSEGRPEHGPHPHAPHGRGHHRHWQGHGRRGGHRHGPFHGPPHPPHGHGHGPSPPPYPGQPGGFPFDFGNMMRAFASHPFAQNLRNFAEQTRDAAQPNDAANESADTEAFTPPVDVFNTERAFVLHVGLPGAQKEDLGVSWDEDKKLLNIAGVIYRPGDEEFLQSLASSERKVGMFERSVTLPPAGSDEKDEVDGFNITAKMENGVLVVTVPKLEKEWTEIRKVDIE